MTVLKRPENLNPYIVFYSDYFGLDDEENLRLQNDVIVKNSKDGEELFVETDDDAPDIEYLGFTFSSIEEITRIANCLLEYILFVW